MPRDFSGKNLQDASFKNEDLRNARFSNSDLRGVDFSGANLSGADFTHVKTGITPTKAVLLFLAALLVSALSGYTAMLAGHTVQGMLKSEDGHVRVAGIVSIIVTIVFIFYYYWKGGGKAFYNLILPIVFIALFTGIVASLSGIGTGKGMLYMVLSLLLVVIMFIIGTIARTVAGTLSNILFMIVALSGGMFGKSVGGGIGTVIMAVSCALISKRALSGAAGFDVLKRIAFTLTSKWGTSFRNTRLADADFSRTALHNSDFSNADIAYVNWGDSKKTNCLVNDQIVTEKEGSGKNRE